MSKYRQVIPFITKGLPIIHPFLFIRQTIAFKGILILWLFLYHLYTYLGAVPPISLKKEKSRLFSLLSVKSSDIIYTKETENPNSLFSRLITFFGIRDFALLYNRREAFY